MKISYNWLKQFIKTDWTSEKTAELLTDLGLEVESVEKYQSIKGGLEGLVVGYVITCEKHPNADKLKITTVNIGTEEPLQIVCGAANVAAGQKVVVATIGTKLFDKNGTAFEIKKGKIRGEESHGMLCAEDEIGLGNSHDGIMILEENLAPGTPIAQIFNVENDEVFEIGLTPNRADAMSHWGVARDLRAGMMQQDINVELITPSVSSYKVEKRTLKIDVNVENTTLVPRYCGVTISDIKIAPSPQWLQNRLKAIGLTPKNNVVDVTNYVLHELGQPLHAFDATKINGKIIVKNATDGEPFTTLDDIQRTLSKEDIIICDEKGPLCIAGVMGGKNSGVTNNTTSIFLESAYFNPIAIRKTAKRHNINSDASFRYERGIDPTITEYALKRAAILIREIAGGEMTSDIVEVHPKKAEDFPVLLNLEKVRKIIGQEIPDDIIKKILVSLDIKVNSISKIGLGLTVPAYRVDVTRDIDVIEEILRVYGYNNIKFSQKLNATTAHAPKTEDYKVQNTIANLLVANGFNEMMANSLTTPTYVQLSNNLHEKNNVTMLNPLSNDLSAMRQSMLFSALEAVSYNMNRKNGNLRLFEFGKTYEKILAGHQEKMHLTLTISGNTTEKSWTTTQKPTSFFSFKSYIHLILERLGIKNYITAPLKSDVFNEGMTYEFGNSTLVEFGTINKTILKHFDIKNEIFFANFNWAALLKHLSTTIKFTEIPKFPEVRRDLALLLDQSVPFSKILELAKQTEKTLLKEVDLFDVYQGNNLPEGKKSYAVSFILQDHTKTLTDSQIEKVMTKLTQVFQEQLNATLR